MKKIFIAIDDNSSEIYGNNSISQHLFARLKLTQEIKNHYFVVTKHRVNDSEYKNQRFNFLNFDTTSFLKLQKVFTNDFYLSVLIISEKENLIETISNIRKISERTPIAFVDYWGIADKDLKNFKNLVPLNQNSILANQFINELPNIPVVAQNVGLRQGEIMEVLIPFGSQYVFRRVGSIEQKEWHISAIYRNNNLILPKANETLQTNDVLILIGEPKLLQSVYRSIQLESKQFPKVFGENIFVLFDMEIDNNELLLSYMKSAIDIQKKIKKTKLFVKILNPTNLLFLRALKSYNSKNIDISVEYSNNFELNNLKKFINSKNIGLSIISNDLFKSYQVRKFFYNQKKPLLKFSQENHELLKLNYVYLLCNEAKQTEQIAITLFDFTKQFELEFSILKDSDLKEMKEFESLEEQFKTLSKILSKRLTFETYDNTKNPIRLLKQKDNIIVAMPFSENILESYTKSIFSKDLSKIYHHLDKHSQIFIPINI